MRYFLLIFVTCSLLIQTSTRSFILASYSINKDYISKNLCKKRSVKKNKCQGSCHLKMKLEQSEKHEKNQPSALSEKADVVLYCNDCLPSIFSTAAVKEDYLPFKTAHFQLTDLAAVFHPPQKLH